MEKPLVSVVMPVYNGEKYIQRAVDSVFEQKVSLELIVIDDCSVDGTEKVMDKYKSRGEVRYFRNKTNIGVSVQETGESGKPRGSMWLFWTQMTGGKRTS